MIIAIGSVISFAPAVGERATVTIKTSVSPRKIVGWAVVCVDRQPGGAMRTEVVPMVWDYDTQKLVKLTL